MIGQSTHRTDPAQTQDASPTTADDVPAAAPSTGADADAEFGGREGLSPTRYGDWEKNGRCIDF